MDPDLSGLPDAAAWLAGLPRLRDEVLGEWSLVPDGPPVSGAHGSLVLPVVAPTGPAVLKLGRPRPETEHEALALQRLGGRGAVRLLRADPRRRALLLERLPGPDLGEWWDVEACEVVGELYASLHQPAPAQLRPLSSYVGRWAAGLSALPRSAPLPHRLVEQAVSLARDLVVDDPARLLHTSLGLGDVLARADGSWVAVGPEPLSGDPHSEPAPLLWSRWDDVVASGDVRDAVRRRFHTVVDTALLDEDRARGWVVLRAVASAAGVLDDAERLTRLVTIAKAVQD